MSGFGSPRPARIWGRVSMPRRDDLAPATVTGLRLEICRQLAWIDVAGVTALSEACVEADADRPFSDRVARRLHRSAVGPDRNIVVLSVSPHGRDRVVGYAHLGPAPDAPGESTEIAVHPAFRGRGIAQLLLRTVREETPDGRLRLIAARLTPITRALARSAGLTSARIREHLTLDMAAAPRVTSLTNGVRIRTFAADRDEAAWSSLCLRIRRSQSRAEPWTVDDVLRRGPGPSFGLEGLLVAEDVTGAEAGRLLGFAWATMDRDGRPETTGDGAEPVTGHLHLGEVVPSAQAPAIRDALAGAAVRWLDARGVSTVSTVVEERPDGPGTVLRRLGFRDHRTDAVFTSPDEAFTDPR